MRFSPTNALRAPYVRVEPHSSPLLLQQGEFLLQQGEFLLQQGEFFTGAVCPRRALELNKQGCCHTHLEKDLESVTDFETALRYEPTSQLHFREKCASLAILETITYNI
eukprot:1193637-Prorocentrum_minimum.AAC.1